MFADDLTGRNQSRNLNPSTTPGYQKSFIKLILGLGYYSIKFEIKSVN